MPKPPLDPPVADQAPTAGDLTAYDHEHLVTYLRLLDATQKGRLARSAKNRPAHRAKRAWESHWPVALRLLRA